MTSFARLSLSVLGAAALSGCNLVTTENPMFTKADAIGAPPMRGGLWRLETRDCIVDETLPRDRWPACAKSFVADGEPGQDGEVAGDPALLQAPLPLQTEGGARTFYLYVAFQPLKRDAEGRVTTIRAWAVQCGPPSRPKLADLQPPTEDRAAPAGGGLYSPTDPLSLTRLDPRTSEPIPGAPRGAGPEASEPQGDLERLGRDATRFALRAAMLLQTKTPLPGMVLNDRGGCGAASPADLRRAAKASEAWAAPPLKAHWVRDQSPAERRTRSPTPAPPSVGAAVKSVRSIPAPSAGP
jgi:hypothetical protein